MRLTGLIPLALLAYLAFLAAPIGLADLYAFGPRRTLARADSTFPAPADPAWSRGRDLLARALELDPRNPNHAENLGLWHERAAQRLPPRSPLAVAYLQQSLGYFRRAATARPGSPYTWSDLGLIKLKLGQVDAELAQSVTNAAHFGPWEPEVQRVVAEILFATYERLPPAAREAARTMVQNALRYQDEKLYELALVYGRLALLCSLPGAGLSKFAIRCI